MLTLIRSPLPALPRDHTRLPVEAGEGLARVEQEPQRCLWVAPTEQRRRALVRDWSTAGTGRATLLPGLHTLESLVAQGLAYSPRPRPRVSEPERLVRIARAWQEVFGRSAGSGLVRQLDRWVSDWQACNLGMPEQPRDVFELLVQRYLRDLESDRLLDRGRGAAVLTAEVLDPHSWPNRLFFDRQRAIILDGFHRLETVELNLIAALAHRCDVWLWLVGTPGQVSWRTVEVATRHLQRRAGSMCVADWIPPAGGLAEVGRRLFPVEEAPPEGETESRAPLAGVWRLEASGPAAEVEAVAKRVKADYLAAEKTGRPFRLSEVALVIPGPAYEPLLREMLPRLGLPFHFAGRSFPVSQSRPARILLAAWQLCRSQWRHDLLLDFLSQPLVNDRLKEAHRLVDLFQHRPRARRLLNYGVWAESWNQQVRTLEDRIARWQSGALNLPERIALSREEFIDRRRQLAASLKALIGSIQTVLAPVAAMDRLMTSPPQGPAPLRKLVRACFDLLQTLRVDLWLRPPSAGGGCQPLSGGRELLSGGREPPEHAPQGAHAPRSGGPHPPLAGLEAEYAKDQQAYARLLEVLHAVERLPEARLPLNPQKRPDGFITLSLALENQTYQVASIADAGVQVVEPAALLGLRFRRVFVLGLLDGQYPPPSEEGALGGRRRRYPALVEQLQQKEDEAAFLFSQVFEAAAEAVVLCRPLLDGEHPTRPSAFLAAVEQQGSVPRLEPATVVAGWREAGSRLGRAGAGRRALGKTVAELWPAAGEQADHLSALLAGLSAFQGRGGWSRQVQIEAPALLRLIFPEDRPFSLSELETYAACPFRYFGNRALRLDERDPDQTRIQYGWLVHRVLQNFYVALHQECGDQDGQPLPTRAADHAGRLLELFEAEWEKLDDGTLPPDLRALFGWEGGILDLLLQTIGLIEADYGNARNEYVLQAAPEKQCVPLGTDPEGRAVYLSGTVDCVSRHRLDPRHAIILDYKTGKAGPRNEVARKMTDGRLLQLPLYAAALQILHPDLEVVGGAYIHLSEKEKEARKAVLAAGALLPAGRAAPLPFNPEAARAKAIELARDIRAGRFALTVHDADEPHGECSFFCALRHACRHPKGYQTPYSS